MYIKFKQFYEIENKYLLHFINIVSKEYFKYFIF